MYAAYGQFFYMLDGHEFFLHTTYGQVLYMLYGKKLPIHAAYIQIFHMLYGLLHYHCTFFLTD